MTCCILPKRVHILDFCSQFTTVPVPPRQPSDDVTVNSPEDSMGDLGAWSPRTVPPLSITFSQLLLHPLTWPHAGLWSETIFPQHELDPDSPAHKSLNTCPGSQDKGGVDMTPVVWTPFSPALEAPCRPVHPSLLLGLPTPFAWSSPIPGQCPIAARDPLVQAWLC